MCVCVCVCVGVLIFFFRMREKGKKASDDFHLFILNATNRHRVWPEARISVQIEFVSSAFEYDLSTF